MPPGRTCLDDVDVRYRALVDVAGALTSHSDLHDLLRSLRGHLEPIVQFTFLSVWLWDRDDGTADRRLLRAGGQRRPRGWSASRSRPPASYPGQAVQTGRADLRHRGRPGRAVVPASVDDRARRPELLRRPARHARTAPSARSTSARVDRRRLRARRHRADGAGRRAWSRSPLENAQQRRDHPRAASRAGARARSARPAARGDQRDRHAARHAARCSWRWRRR